MWPFSSVPVELLRIGRIAAERWTGTAASPLALVASSALEEGAMMRPEGLVAALRTLYGNDKPEVVVVLESSWLPLALIDAGDLPLSSSQQTSLARHRFALYFDEAEDPTSGWQIRVERRRGARHMLAYGFPGRISSGLSLASAAVGVKFIGVHPALSWGFESARRAGSAFQGFWWLWPEQDRMLALHTGAGVPDGLHPAAVLPTVSQDILDLVAAEEFRGGQGSGDPIFINAWGASMWSDLVAVTRVTLLRVGESSQRSIRNRSSALAS